MYADYLAYLPHNTNIAVKTKQGNILHLAYSLNMPTGTFWEITALTDALSRSTGMENQVELLATATALITERADERYNKDWVISFLDVDTQASIIQKTLEYITNIIRSENFEIPDIDVDLTKNEESSKKDAKARADEAKKKQRKMNEDLFRANKEQDIMSDIYLVMANTSNSYEDVLNMPILAYRALLKNICISRFSQNEDWRAAYVQKELEKIGAKATVKDLAKKARQATSAEDVAAFFA